MKKLLIIALLFAGYGFSFDIKSSNFTIYSEIVGLGGLPSLNIEYPKNKFNIRYWLSIIYSRKAITLPIAINKIYGSGKQKQELGIGLFSVIPYANQISVKNKSEIGIVGLFNYRREPDKGSFRRIGLILGYSSLGNVIFLPTLGWGINAN